MTTPEQLQAWRKEFEAQLLPATEMTLDVMGKYWLNGLETQWQGYLRAKQETEQAIKNARKQALEEAIAICNAVCSPYPTDQGDGYNEGALDCEKKIKELLK